MTNMTHRHRSPKPVETSNAHRRLLEIAANDPGISYRKAARHMDVKRPTLRSYASVCKRAGWLRYGPVPTLQDIGLDIIPDWRAADHLTKRLRDVYGWICLRYTLELPNRRSDFLQYHLTDNQIADAFDRLRTAGVISEVDELHLTKRGQYLVAGDLGWKMKRTPWRAA